MTRGLPLVLLAAATMVAEARDTTGLSEQLTQEQREWASSLRNKSGQLCCNDADGMDPVWRTSRESPSGYQVLLDGEWQDVSEQALITEPNKLGVARVWVYGGGPGGKRGVRCFIAGAGG